MSFSQDVYWQHLEKLIGEVKNIDHLFAKQYSAGKPPAFMWMPVERTTL